MRFFVTGDTAWPDERTYVHIKRIVLTKPVSTADTLNEQENSNAQISPIGNSLAYLLTQKQKPVQADVHAVSKKTSVIGNSLAYLLTKTRHVQYN